MNNQIKLDVQMGNIHLKNPVMTASGTFGYASEFKNYVDLNCLGGIVVKGISLKPSSGNQPPRVIETACGMLNSIGLENVGLDIFIEEKMKFLSKISAPVFVNIYGKTISEYAELAERLDEQDKIAGIEINISCPNVSAGGLAFGTDPKTAHQVVKEVSNKTSKFLIVKLTPNVTDIGLIAKYVEDAGADAISLINTLTGMAIDINTRKPKLANIVGGLSGPAIKPVALRMVWQVTQKVKIPVIGIGGIMNYEDALEFLIVGAKAIQVGTANFINTKTTIEIIEGLKSYLKNNNINCINDIIGTLIL